MANEKRAGAVFWCVLLGELAGCSAAPATARHSTNQLATGGNSNALNNGTGGATASGGTGRNAGGSAGQSGGTNNASGGSSSVSGASGGASTTSGGANSSSGGNNSSLGGQSTGAGSGGTQGAPSTNPSCSGLPATCGKTRNLDCCTSNLVPGGTFNRSNDANFPATLSNFRLDNFKVTVGRFRKFVAAYRLNMFTTGVGKNPHNAMDTGWNPAWNAQMPADSAALKENVAGFNDGSNGPQYTADPGDRENHPMNGVDWYESQAFCIWDGGRLPTEAEWNYAAAGGGEQRKYPWGNNAPGQDTNLAIYACLWPGTGGVMDANCGDTKDPYFVAPVGSAPGGNGRWGQSDMAGELWDWLFDNFKGGAAYTMPCNDCGPMLDTSPTDNPMLRGGVFYSTVMDGDDQLATDYRNGMGTAEGRYQVGFRCARNP